MARCSEQSHPIQEWRSVDEGPSLTAEDAHHLGAEQAGGDESPGPVHPGLDVRAFRNIEDRAESNRGVEIDEVAARETQ